MAPLAPATMGRWFPGTRLGMTCSGASGRALPGAAPARPVVLALAGDQDAGGQVAAARDADELHRLGHAAHLDDQDRPRLLEAAGVGCHLRGHHDLHALLL